MESPPECNGMAVASSATPEVCGGLEGPSSEDGQMLHEDNGATPVGERRVKLLMDLNKPTSEELVHIYIYTASFCSVSFDFPESLSLSLTD